jgi:hypothetical protein
VTLKGRCRYARAVRIFPDTPDRPPGGRPAPPGGRRLRL